MINVTLTGLAIGKRCKITGKKKEKAIRLSFIINKFIAEYKKGV